MSLSSIPNHHFFATPKTASQAFYLRQWNSVENIHGKLSRESPEAAFKRREEGRSRPSHVVVQASRIARVLDRDPVEQMVRRYSSRQVFIAVSTPVADVPP
jgi:hypothetical protein